MKQLTIILVVISIIAIMMGGLSDLTGKRYLISKEHYWNDGMYLLLLAIFVELFI